MAIRGMRGAALSAGALALTAAMWSAAASPPGVAGGGTGNGPAHARRDVYGITNLAPPPVHRAFINARSQVAFEYTGTDDSIHVGFFDGRRVLEVDPPGALASFLGGLNDRGAIAGSTLPGTADTFQPFRWTATGGPALLPDPHPAADTFTSTINNRGQIVGFSQTVDLAARWDAANRLAPLHLPRGFTQSVAYDINEANVTAGGATAADGSGHAVLWDAAGRLYDLGRFGATSAFAALINDRNEVAGGTTTVDPAGNGRVRAFLWNRRAGVALVPRPESQSVIDALNGRDEAVGRLLPADAPGIRAFYFSRKRGLVDLHRAPFVESSAADINDGGTIVGSMTRTNPDGSPNERAFRWSNFVPVDLNTRLLNAPAGLVLSQALRISPSGDIVASSNAGLVLLRLGGAGTDEPLLGPVTLDEFIRPNVATTLIQSFSDRNTRDTHTATVDWGDGSGPQHATVRENKGRGQLSATHTYSSSGNFTIVIRVTDSASKTTTTYRNVRVEEPRPFLGSANAGGDAGSAVKGRGELIGREISPALRARLDK